MAGQKVPQAVIDEIRDRVDIVAIVSDFVLLKRSGANFSGLCPFHTEKSPSFTVHPVKRIFHCFGCGVGGNVFAFIMKIQNVSFPAALEKLAAQAGIDLTPYKGRGEEVDFVRAHNLMRDAQKFFRQELASSAPAKEYLARRGLTAQTIREFGLGWAPDEWRKLADHLQKLGYSIEELVTFGLIRKKEAGFYDYFRGRIMFPIEDEFGKPVGFGGRILGDAQPKYLNSPESVLYSKGRMLYNLHRAIAAIAGQESPVLLLVEGYMDVIGLVQAGFRNVVATCGTALTETQVRKLAKAAKKLVFAYDPDPAGVRATLRAMPLVEKTGLLLSMLTLPEGVDPDEFVQKEGADAMTDRLAKGKSVETFLFEATLERHSEWRSPDGKRAALRELAEVFKHLPSPVSQQNFLERVSDAFAINQELLVKSMTNSPDKAAAVENVVGTTRPQVISPLVQAERTLVFCFMSEVSTYRRAAGEVRIGEFRDPYCKRILQLMPDLERDAGDVSDTLMSTCEDEELSRFISAELMARPSLDPESVDGVLTDCLRELKKYRLESRKRELLRLVASDGAGEEVLREFKEVTEELQSLMKSLEEPARPVPQAR